ncbi:MAG: undecaprenyl-diphosphate phosphatase, partial [Alphaproteobacteria bacterium]|nr:undecaprenyl-diphosphate phosphatase [Alphaproteobacteria bacterium]
VRLNHAILIGLAQAVAIIPGASRAGMTMTAARALGFDRTAAARFSMLLAIPTIIAAGLLASLDLIRTGNAQLGLDALVAALLAFAAAYVAITLFLRWVRHASLTPFVIYRVVLGLVLIGISWA